MSEDGFWAIIGPTPAITDPEAAAQHVTEVLTGLSGDEIEGFATDLSRVVNRLDTGEHRAHAGEQSGPTRLIGDDAFLHVRLGVVLAGRAAYDAVALDPQLIFGVAEPWVDGAESLLDAAPLAYTQVTGLRWDHTPDVSHESTPSLPSSPPDAVTEPTMWFIFGMGLDSGVKIPQAYDVAWIALSRHILRDADMRSWWLTSGREELHYFPLYTKSPTELRKPARVKVGRRSVEYLATRHPATLRGPHPAGSREDRRFQAEQVLQEADQIFTAVAEKLGMPHHPPFPDPETITTIRW